MALCRAERAFCEVNVAISCAIKAIAGCKAFRVGDVCFVCGG